MELQPGDILLTRSNGLIGGIIRVGEYIHVDGWREAMGRFWRWAKYRQPLSSTPHDPAWVNHAAVYVGNGEVIEALAQGLVRSPVSKYHPTQFIVIKLEAIKPGVDDAHREDLIEFADAEADRHDKYGWFSIFSIIVQILTPLKLNLTWKDSMICSAFAARCLEHAGVTLPMWDPYVVTPADLSRNFPTVLPTEG